MAVIEYKMYINEQGRRAVPGFVEDRGHWYSDSDHTYVGWANYGEFYIPDTVLTLTKEQFVARGTAAGHMTKPASWDSATMGAWSAPDLNTWYDEFTTKNS